MLLFASWGLGTGIPVSGILGILRHFRFPVSRIFMTKNSRFCELLYVILLRQPCDVSKAKSFCLFRLGRHNASCLVFKLFPVDYEINRFESV